MRILSGHENAGGFALENWKFMGGVYKRQVQQFHHVQHITLFSEEEYKNALEKAGFTIRARLSEQEFRMGAFVCTK